MTGYQGFDEAFILLAPGTDPAADRHVIEHTGGRTLLVWVPDGTVAANVAGALAEGGVRLIELYRGFTLTTTAQVIGAVGGRAPVGVAGYGTGPLPDHRALRSATIYSDPQADPAAGHIRREHPGGGSTTVVASPTDAAAQVAVDLVDAGAELIELCGGTPLTIAEAVREAVGGRVPVTVVAWPFESIDGVAAYKAAFEASLA